LPNRIPRDLKKRRSLDIANENSLGNNRLWGPASLKSPNLGSRSCLNIRVNHSLLGPPSSIPDSSIFFFKSSHET